MTSMITSGCSGGLTWHQDIRSVAVELSQTRSKLSVLWKENCCTPSVFGLSLVILQQQQQYELNNNDNNRIKRRNSRFLQSRHCTANKLQHIRSSSPGAIMCKSHPAQRALITCNMLCYVPCGTKGQLSY